MVGDGSIREGERERESSRWKTLRQARGGIERGRGREKTKGSAHPAVIESGFGDCHRVDNR